MLFSKNGIKSLFRTVLGKAFLLVLLVIGIGCFVAAKNCEAVYASEQQSLTETSEETPEGTTQETETVSESGSAASDSDTTKEPAFTGKEKFVVFVCCLFSVAICLLLALYGNPNDRLKDKYKRAKKRQMAEEKRKREAEARAAKRAAEDAKYAEELAQYEADVKAYEEAKAAKAAAKAAKRAEKEAKRSN